MLGLQRRECELRYEFYIESTEHMNTGEGWRGMGSNDELNYIYMLFSCSHFYSTLQPQLLLQHTDVGLIPKMQIYGSEHLPIDHHGDAIFVFPLTALCGECHF